MKNRRVRVRCSIVFAAHLFLSAAGFGRPLDSPRVIPTTRLLAERAVDQDDISVWLDPRDHQDSTVIAADKKANLIFVYGLDGELLQEIPALKPGNVDVRYGFPSASGTVDIVVSLQRIEGPRLLVFAVDPETRHLRRIDDDSLRLNGEGKGGTLYHSRSSGRFFFVKTAQDEGEGGVEQFELSDDGTGRVTGRRVRQWPLSGCEGAVADDEKGILFLAEEDRGVWKVGAEPEDPVPGELIIRIGENGLIPDIEGLALYRTGPGSGYLVVSNQEKSDFKLYDRQSPHRFLGTFVVDSVIAPDGIEVVDVSLGPRYPAGVFLTHTELAQSDRCAIFLTSWDEVARATGIARESGLKQPSSGRRPGLGRGKRLVAP